MGKFLPSGEYLLFLPEISGYKNHGQIEYLTEISIKSVFIQHITIGKTTPINQQQNINDKSLCLMIFAADIII
ncbi:hypothetical protein [Xenorhabdus nematophila]|uniref:hypothetical protein n=1 Tax=Xenorhabdus nematophila TaxID=628 RepID=UPI0011806054|nr:hypothetical protein [Xenorhabdus nematophila]